MVRQNNTIKYSNKIGQKTGISKASKKVVKNANKVDLTTAHQHLNSGNRRMKGRNSSSCLVGNPGICSSKKKIC